MFDERLHLSCQFVSRRRSVPSERHATECQDNFRKDWLIDRESRNSKRSPVRRMSVTNSFHIRTLAIDQQVHRELARRFSLVELVAFEIRDRDQIVGHATLARHRRRGEDTTVVETDADVAIRRNDITSFVHQMANLDQIPSCCLFIHASVAAVLRRGCVTVLFDGCERKYDNDSSEVVRSTVLTLTPRRAVSETGAKLSTALMPADITWLSTRCAAFAGTAITITSSASSRITCATSSTSCTTIFASPIRRPIFCLSLSNSATTVKFERPKPL